MIGILMCAEFAMALYGHFCHSSTKFEVEDGLWLIDSQKVNSTKLCPVVCSSLSLSVCLYYT